MDATRSLISRLVIAAGALDGRALQPGAEHSALTTSALSSPDRAPDLSPWSRSHAGVHVILWDEDDIPRADPGEPMGLLRAGRQADRGGAGRIGEPSEASVVERTSTRSRVGGSPDQTGHAAGTA